MYIYSSKDEIAIEGSPSELNNLSNIIAKCEVGETHQFEASLKTTAEPYETLLRKIVVNCSHSKIKTSITDNVLNLEFSIDSKEIVSSYFMFPLNSNAGDHCHFDKFGNEDNFDDESLEVVIQVG